MYHPVEIKHLSKVQMSKLLKGHPVRVSHGKGHQIEVSHEQHKKIAKAHEKGKAVTITFDPYQQSNHQHLKGKGFLDDMGRQAHKYAGQAINNGVRIADNMAHRINHQFSQVNNKLRGGGFLDVINDIGHKTGEAFSLGNNIPFNPYDLGYQLGHDVIAPALMKGSGAKRRGGKCGGSIWGDVRGAFDRPEVQSVGRMLQPLAEKALNKAGDMAINYAMKSGESGEGIHKHPSHRRAHLHKKVAKPRAKKHGGSLYPSGYYA